MKLLLRSSSLTKEKGRQTNAPSTGPILEMNLTRGLVEFMFSYSRRLKITGVEWVNGNILITKKEWVTHFAFFGVRERNVQRGSL